MKRTILCLSTLLLCAQLAVAGFTVYEQPPASGPPVAYFSVTDTSPTGLGQLAVVYDNFRLAQDIEITDVHWRGAYDLEPIGILEGFSITFWSNSVTDEPGAALANYAISGDANETFVGYETDVTGGQVPVYDYSVDLPTPFGVTGGQMYWLSIVAIDQTESFRGLWGWHVGTGGIPIAAMDVFDQDWDDDGGGTLNPYPGEGRVRFEGDMAFALTAIPEPASLVVWLTVMSVLGLGLVRSRRG